MGSLTALVAHDRDTFTKVKRMLRLRGQVVWIGTPEDVAHLIQNGRKCVVVIDRTVHKYVSHELSHEAHGEHPFRKALREINIVRRRSGLVTHTTWVDLEDRSWRTREEGGRDGQQ